MARRTKETPEAEADSSPDISADLIADLNKEFGSRVAYNLTTGDSPTHVKRWISTGSILLDYIISNRRDGGFPEGRLIEISGMPSTGKSHIAFQTARTVQRLNGYVIYIDSENATPVDKLASMGIDVAKRFIYLDAHMTEDVFKIMEMALSRTKDKDVPVLVVWDSVAATSPKEELEGDYDEMKMGVQARVIAKALRKIIGIIGTSRAVVLCLNQLKMKIGVTYGDPRFTPGGNAIPFHASVRLRLTGETKVKNAAGVVVGIHPSAEVIKNKIAPPWRKVEYDLLFGRGIMEDESLVDILRQACSVKGGPTYVTSHGFRYSITGAGGWKEFTVASEADGEIVLEKKFTKSMFGDMLRSEQFGTHLHNMIEAVMVVKMDATTPVGDSTSGADDAEEAEAEAAEADA
jgi:recombination protein RecA